MASNTNKVLLLALKPALAEKLAQMPLLQQISKRRGSGTSDTSDVLKMGRSDCVACLRGLTVLAELDVSQDPKLLPANITACLPQLCVLSPPIRFLNLSRSIPGFWVFCRSGCMCML